MGDLAAACNVQRAARHTPMWRVLRHGGGVPRRGLITSVLLRHSNHPAQSATRCWFATSRLQALRQRLQDEDNDPGGAQQDVGGHVGHVTQSSQAKAPKRRAPAVNHAAVAAANRLFRDGDSGTGDQFWRRTEAFCDVPAELFLCPHWQKRNTVSGAEKLRKFMSREIAASPTSTSTSTGSSAPPLPLAEINPRSNVKRNDEFCDDVVRCLEQRPMKVKLTP